MRDAVYKLVQNCLVCKEARSRYLKFKYPMSPKLPDFRTCYIAPFASCGVDLAGPFLVLRDTFKIKTWIVLFTCLVTRATYLVLVTDLRASTFLYAFRELCARHSTPIVMVSDNATNFTHTSRLLSRIKTDLDRSMQVPLEWKFIPVKAPWVGGIYERLIGIMKNELRKMTRGARISYVEFKSHIHEVERIMNDRPLQHVGGTEVITPAMLIYGRKVDRDSSLSSVQIDTLLQNTKILGRKLPTIYAENIKRKNEFWKAFQAQYLDLLKFRTGRKESGSKGRIPKLGDLVMIHEADPRIKPKKGLITQVLKSDDGEIRKCKVKMGAHESIRPVCSFRDLEMNVFDETDIGVRQNSGDHRFRDGIYEVLLSKSDNAVVPTSIEVPNTTPSIVVSPPEPTTLPVVKDQDKEASVTVDKLSNVPLRKRYPVRKSAETARARFFSLYKDSLA